MVATIDLSMVARHGLLPDCVNGAVAGGHVGHPGARLREPVQNRGFLYPKDSKDSICTIPVQNNRVSVLCDHFFLAKFNSILF